MASRGITAADSLMVVSESSAAKGVPLLDAVYTLGCLAFTDYLKRASSRLSNKKNGSHNENWTYEVFYSIYHLYTIVIV